MIPTPVVILLATYNGADFLVEQLQSLLGQSHPHCHILIRDDGSSDQTPAIVEGFRAQYPTQITVLSGPNLGFVGNFLALIAAAPPGQAGYFFCDQDDVWLPHKVEQALQKIQQADSTGEQPVLYFGRLSVVDSELKPLALSPLINRWGLGNALFENPVTGCTMAINSPALQLLQRYPAKPDRIVAHDWWCYLLATAFGRLVYDPEPLILYRQHAKNSLGASGSRWQALQVRWQNFRAGRWAKRRPEPMIAHFLQLYEEILPAQQKSLIETASLQRRGLGPCLLLWLKGSIWRRGWFNQALLLLLLCKGPEKSPSLR